MKKEISEHLDNLDIYELINSGRLESTIGKKARKTYKKGTYIYESGMESDLVYYVLEGRVKIGRSTEKNKEVTKTIVTKGEIFGELAVINEELRRDFALAMDDVEVFELTVNDIQNLMKEYRITGAFFMKLMGNRVIEMERRLESLVFNDSRSRIIEYLLQLMEKSGERVGYEYVIRNFLAHKEIANITATSRQTVTTVLNELRNAEIITFNRKRLLIRNVDKLKAQLGQ